MERIPNKIFREFIGPESDKLSPYAVAHFLNWYRNDRKWKCADGDRVKRVLGIKAYKANGKPGHRQVTISYEMAEKLASYIGCDPMDVGI